MHWARLTALPFLMNGFLTSVYIAGKSVGPDSLSRNPQYHVTVNLNVFLHSQARMFKELFYMKPEEWFNAQWLVSVWVLLFYVAWRRCDNYLKWAMLFTVIAPLPIALIPGRSGACLYIPWFGWALWLAALAAIFCNFLSRKPLLRRLPRNWACAIPLLLIVVLTWNQTKRQDRKIAPYLKGIDAYFWALKGQLQLRLPKVKPGTQIAYYRDSSANWDPKFITELLYHDRSVHVRLHRYQPLTPEDFNKTDYVLHYHQIELKILKRPGEPFQIPQ